MKVEVNTDTLKAGGTSVANYCSDSEQPYNNAVSISSGNCTSLESFKSSLKGKFSTFSEHSTITDTKLNECASELEEIDNLIGNNVTNLLPDNANDSEDTSLVVDDSLALGLDDLTPFDVNIGNLAALSDNDRKSTLNSLYSELGNVVTSIENGNGYTYSGNNQIVNSLVNQFYQNIKVNSQNVGHDLIKNDFYNSVVKKYGQIANVKITPDMLRYGSRNGRPLVRENFEDYNLSFNGNNKPVKVGDEFDFKTWGFAFGEDKCNDYPKEKLDYFKNLHSKYYQDQTFDSFQEYRKYTYYPSSTTRHYRTNEWYLCDDGFYRDADGYLVCADKWNMGYDKDGKPITNALQIDNDNLTIVDTPFGKGRVYDYCEAGNIDIYAK